MAVKYKDLKNKLELEPLNKKELEYINSAERYIDSLILRVFDDNEIIINMDIFDFECTTNSSIIKNINKSRKRLMRKELEKRYISAGWEIKEDFQDSGPDYIILSGKK